MTTTDNIEHLRDWVGRTETAGERLSGSLVDRFRATLDTRLAPTSAYAPLGIHWCLAPMAVPHDQLGSDGHPRRGGFLPPISLPRRMWAGGTLTFLAPIPLDSDVVRTSRIASVERKEGKTGPIFIVQVEHVLNCNGAVAIQETQDLVYLGPQPKGIVQSRPEATPEPDVTETVLADPPLLFRYSALTFNAHRIHYDRDYARDEENYKDLVVHGPLQATLLLNLAAKTRTDRNLQRFEYRALAPLFCDRPFTINARTVDEDLALWSASADGGVGMTARTNFHSS